VTPLAWSLLMLALLLVSGLGGRFLGRLLAQRHKMSPSIQNRDGIQPQAERERPSGLVMRFVDGSPQVESSEEHEPDQEVVQKMVEDAEAYAAGIYREPDKGDERDQ
jgi:hypothetical protein